MKKLILFILLCLPITIVAQNQIDGYLGELPMSKGRVFYTGIDTVQSASKDELFNRAKIF